MSPLLWVQVVKVQVTLQRWEQLPALAAEREVLNTELLSACESIEWQVRAKKKLKNILLLQAF